MSTHALSLAQSHYIARDEKNATVLEKHLSSDELNSYKKGRSLMSIDTIAENYYIAMGRKDSTAVEKYLHPDVQFTGPVVSTKGKEAVLGAVKKFMSFFKALTIRAKFGSKDQAMIVYDVEFPSPIGNVASVAYLTFNEKNLITNIELFFDARAMDRK